jgi:hypothetical protein
MACISKGTTTHKHYLVGSETVDSAELRAEWSGVRDPGGAGNFYTQHRVQTGSGTHLSSYPVGTRGSFPGIKRPEWEANHTPPSSAEVIEEGSYTSSSPIHLHGIVFN